MTKLNVRVIKARVKATPTHQNSIINRENAQTIKPEKHTPREIIKAIFRGIQMFGLCFLSYNTALVLVAVIGSGMFWLMNSSFIKLVNSTAFAEIFQSLFNWACAHSIFSVIVLVFLYIIGFLWFIYKFVNESAKEILKQE